MVTSKKGFLHSLGALRVERTTPGCGCVRFIHQLSSVLGHSCKCYIGPAEAAELMMEVHPSRVAWERTEFGFISAAAAAENKQRWSSSWSLRGH